MKKQYTPTTVAAATATTIIMGKVISMKMIPEAMMRRATITDAAVIIMTMTMTMRSLFPTIIPMIRKWQGM